MTKEEPLRKKQRLAAPLPPFSGTSLELVCQFLTAEEAGKCCIACKTWRADLMGPGTMNDDAEAASVHPNPFVWRQVALNTSPKSLLMIERLAETEDPLNYYRIGAGVTRASRLVEIQSPEWQPPADEPEMPRPSNPPFDRINLLAVCELVHKVKVENEDTEKEPEYRLETLEVFGCGDCSTWMDPNEDAVWDQCALELTPNPDAPSFIMKGDNPLKENYIPGPAPDLAFDREEFLEFYRSARERGEAEVYWTERVTPLEVSSVDALYKVDFACMRLILFRRDDWRSVCLKQNCRPNRQTNIYWGGRRDEHPEAVIPRLPYRFRGRLPLKDPDKVHEFSLIEALRLEAVLPRPGAPDEPKWLKETRKSNVADLDWTSQDEEEVLGVESFTFQFKSIAINSIFHWGRSTRRCTRRELLGCLEHFDWK